MYLLHRPVGVDPVPTPAPPRRMFCFWTGENATVLSVDVVIQPTQKSVDGTKSGIVKKGADAGEIRIGASASLSAASEISAPLDPRFTFDQFVVGNSVDAGQNAVVCNLAGADESPTECFGHFFPEK